MAVINRRLSSGTLGTSNATLYTVPTGKSTIIKSITLCNITDTSVTLTLKLNGVELYLDKSINAKDTLIINPLDQIIGSTELIEGSASASAAIKYMISGKEFS